MSYAKAMKHARNVRKCRKQGNMHFGFDVSSGFWPSHAFLKEDYWPYVEACKAKGLEPMSAEAYYKGAL